MRPEPLDILILGPVPPPFGGVAVHIDRLVPALERAGFSAGVLNHFDSRERAFVLDALRRNPWNYYRRPGGFPSRIVHYHHSRWSTLLAVAAGQTSGRRYLITLHSDELRRPLESRNPAVRALTKWALRRFDPIIAVNPQIQQLIERHLVTRDVEVLPAFLDPVVPTTPYEAPLESLLHSGVTAVVPAYRIRFLKDGREVYGLDVATRAFAMVAPERPELRLAIFLADAPSAAKEKRYLMMLEEIVAGAGLENRFMILFGESLLPAFRHKVVVVRPTRTEGDALSIREALQVGAPVIASDAAARPAGTVTFRTDDAESLAHRVREVLAGHWQQRQTGEDVGEQFLERLVEIYRALIERGEATARFTR